MVLLFGDSLLIVLATNCISCCVDVWWPSVLFFTFMVWFLIDAAIEDNILIVWHLFLVQCLQSSYCLKMFFLLEVDEQMKMFFSLYKQNSKIPLS